MSPRMTQLSIETKQTFPLLSRCRRIRKQNPNRLFPKSFSPKKQKGSPRKPKNPREKSRKKWKNLQKRLEIISKTPQIRESLAETSPSARRHPSSQKNPAPNNLETGCNLLSVVVAALTGPPPRARQPPNLSGFTPRRRPLAASFANADAPSQTPTPTSQTPAHTPAAPESMSPDETEPEPTHPSPPQSADPQ